MALSFETQPRDYLLQAIRNGRALVILGAGASRTSKDRDGNEVKMGEDLAALLAKEAGLPYNGERLGKVLTACRPRIISDQRFFDILQYFYLRISPSAELIELLSYSWARIYTWNIDDSIENIKRTSQSRLYFNGLIDGVFTNHSDSQVPVVHLHGEAQKPEHGFIFSESEYNRQILHSSHKWYRQLSQDYASFVPIFIGSRIEEPILALELERARPDPGTGLGQAFLITPDELSLIDQKAFEAKDVVVGKGTLADFIQFLEAEIGQSFTPADVATAKSAFAAKLVAETRLSPDEVDTAQWIFRITAQDISREIDGVSPHVRSEAARAFLEGNPPNWRVAASEAAVYLKQTGELESFVDQIVNGEMQLGVVVGQLGSGKTTALMQTLLEYSRSHDNSAIYEIKSSVKSLRSAFELLERSIYEDKIIVYIADASPFGDGFAEDIARLNGKRFKVFTSARPGEWKSRLGRRLRNNSQTFTFDRFSEDDFGPLIQKLLQFVPAPALLKLNAEQRINRLRESKSQLLIALKEATSARAFTDLITEEYSSLEKVDYQLLLLIAGLGSIARTGLTLGATRSAYEYARCETPFEESWDRLSGIVLTHNNRVSARHELYVRHILENVADLSDIILSIKSILSTFTQIGHPIIRNVPRLDSTLFKFLLNHNFLKDLSVRHGSKREGLQVYEEFERAFQLDGHFWLQYGQYHSEIGELDEALVKLTNSIDAYPGNQFALHALADLQLKVASRRPKFDSETRELVGDAVDALRMQDQTPELAGDFYPIVTLANEHVGALFKHGQTTAANEAANAYAEIIRGYRKNDDSDQLRKAHTRLLTYLSTERWL